MAPLRLPSARKWQKLRDFGELDHVAPKLEWCCSCTGNTIWLPYMSEARIKTTVYLDPDVYRRLKQIGRARSTSPAALLREAVVSYADTHAPRRLPRSIGAGASGTPDLASRVDTVLADGFGRDE